MAHGREDGAATQRREVGPEQEFHGLGERAEAPRIPDQQQHEADEQRHEPAHRLLQPVADAPCHDHHRDGQKQRVPGQ